MEEIVEATVYRQLTFVNEAFDEIDKYNNGFLNGSCTSDNLFILNGLVERQLSLGRDLYVCFVNFSKAFDKISRSILFYKIMKNGWKGKVIDTFRSLYDKTLFREKRNGKLIPVILKALELTNEELLVAIFGLQKKLKCMKALTPEIRFDIFDTMIRPIITYGSDVWGHCKSRLYDLDKLFLNYIRCVLCIKATTSNIIVYGECGKFPPSIYCHANVLCCFHRLLTMYHGSTVKSVFNVLFNLNDQGFQTWISRA